MTARQDQIFVGITEQMAVFLWILLDKRRCEFLVLGGIHFSAFSYSIEIEIKAMFDKPSDVSHIGAGSVIPKPRKIRVWSIE